MAKNDNQRRFGPGAPSPRLSSWVVAAMFGMIAVPAYFTLHTARIEPRYPDLAQSLPLWLHRQSSSLHYSDYRHCLLVHPARGNKDLAEGLLVDHRDPLPTRCLARFPLRRPASFYFPTSARLWESKRPRFETGCRSRNTSFTSQVSSPPCCSTSDSTNTGSPPMPCRDRQTTVPTSTGSFVSIRSPCSWRPR